MKFTTGEIISAGTGKLCCPVERLYAIYNFLTGDDLMTHQLPRAFRACEAHVRKQCPWLDDLNAEEVNPETWKAWLAKAEARVGLEHELEPLPAGEWMKCNPITEAIQLMGGRDKVVVVNAE